MASRISGSSSTTRTPLRDMTHRLGCKVTLDDLQEPLLPQRVDAFLAIACGCDGVDHVADISIVLDDQHGVRHAAYNSIASHRRVKPCVALMPLSHPHSHYTWARLVRFWTIVARLLSTAEHSRHEGIHLDLPAA